MSKSDQLHELALERQKTRWPGYSQVGDFHGGAYECHFVSPFTKSAHNLNAAVFLLLQDWCSEDFLRGPLDRDLVDFGMSPGLPTNQNLACLLKRFLQLAIADTYATNLFPFIKPGPLSTSIPFQDLVAAAREFALPQIAIIQPRLVICLGVQTFRAVQRATGYSPASRTESAVKSSFRVAAAHVWCQAHTGGLGQANRNRGGIDRVSEDWLEMARAFHGAA